MCMVTKYTGSNIIFETAFDRACHKWRVEMFTNITYPLYKNQQVANYLYHGNYYDKKKMCMVIISSLLITSTASLDYSSIK